MGTKIYHRCLNGQFDNAIVELIS